MSTERPTVVITGGSRGLGFGLATAFLELGCTVAISGRDQDSTDKAAAKLSAATPGAEVLAVKADVASYADCERLWTEAKRGFGKVDLWINNAGQGGEPVAFAATSPAAISGVVNANLTGSMNGARAALEGMTAQGHGQICNVEGFGSSGSMREGMTVYGATKYAIRYFTRSLALELKGKPVIVSTLIPGLVATDMLKVQFDAATAGRKKLYEALADKPETIAAGVAPRLLANRRNGAVISWIGPAMLLGRLLLPKYKHRKLLAGS